MGRLANFTIIAILICHFNLALALPGDSSSVKFQVERASDTLFIGQELAIRITAVYPDGTRLHPLTDNKSEKEFYIKKSTLVSSKKSADKIHDRYEFITTFFATGNQTIPDFEFAWLDSTGTTIPLKVSPGAVFVKSVLPVDTAGIDIKDIIEPQGFPSRTWLLVLIIMAITSLIIMAYLFYRRRLLKMNMPQIPVENPYDKAIRKLEELSSSQLIEKGNFKQFYVELTFILRDYIESRFGIAAVESTTYELKKSLKHDELPIEQAQAAIKLLLRADLVKFAKHLPLPQDAENDFGVVKSFVMATKPMPVEVEVTR